MSIKFGMPPRLTLSDPDGQDLGFISREGITEGLESGKKAFVVKGHTGMTLTVTKEAMHRPEIKALLLAAVPVMDLSGIGKRFVKT